MKTKIKKPGILLYSSALLFFAAAVIAGQNYIIIARQPGFTTVEILLPEDVKEKNTTKVENKHKKGPDAQREYFKYLHQPFAPELNPEILDKMWKEVKALPSEEDAGGKLTKGWTCLGPYGAQVRNELAFWSGRIKDVEPPTSEKPLRVSAASGGLWEFFYLFPNSLSDDISSLVISTFVTDPNDINHIFIGTGECNLRSGTGLWQTHDGGLTWQKNLNISPDPYYFYRIRYSPGSPSKIHAVTSSGYWRSLDNGQTWALKFPGNCTDIAINTTNPDIMYITVWNSGVYKSTNGGTNWQKLTNLPTTNVGRSSVSLCRDYPNYVYVTMTTYVADTTMGVYRSTNDGLTWQNIKPPDEFHFGQGWYDNTMGVSPVNPNIVFTGGVRLYRTLDGGVTWTKMINDYLHDDHHAVAFSNDGSKVYIGNDGGIIYSDDLGANWYTTFNILPITQYYHIDVNPLDGKYITGGAQDNGVSTTTNGNTWDIVVAWNGGDGFGTSIDPNNNARQWATNGIYSDQFPVHIFHTTNSWNNIVYINNGIDPPGDQSSISIRNDFVDPVYLFTHNGPFVYTSTNYGLNWTKMNTTPFPTGWIYELTISRWSGGNSVIYACLPSATPGQRLMVYDNGNWQERSSNEFASGLWIKIVRPHPYDKNKAYAVMNGISTSQPTKKVFKTTNKGLTWTNITGNLPNVPLTDIVPHPLDDNKLYVGSEFGCFRTLDGGINWQRWNFGMPEANLIAEMAFVDSLSINGKFYIVAASHGRGVWRREVGCEDPHEWTGAVDHNWHNPLNWNNMSVPDSLDDVVIRNVTNKCQVYAGNARCNDLIIKGGSGNQLKINNKELFVYGDLTAYSELVMDHDLGTLIIMGDANWEAGSKTNFCSSSVIGVYGDWNIKPGANHKPPDGTVAFMGSNMSYIRCHSAESFFNNIRVQKINTGKLVMNNESVQDLEVKGVFEIYYNSVFEYNCERVIKFSSNFNNSGSYSFNSGTVEFTGQNQSIIENPGVSTSGFFNHVTIKSSGTVFVANKNMDINGTITIESGVFDPVNHTIFVAGAWYNQLGPSGFNEGNGKVVFDGGNYFQYCYNEHFNILEISKMQGGLVNISGHNVSCNRYNWESGGLWVMSGSFTANDLADNGIFGQYIILPGGQVDLSNYDGWVDINGYIEIVGGTMNIFGGTTPSYWPYAGNASVKMTGGTLDFHDQGIYIYNNPYYTLNEEISGGLIRTAGGFWGESGSFTPLGGTMEFYGSNDVNVYCINGCHLFNVLINKASDKIISGALDSKQPLFDERSGISLGDGTKSNTLNMTGFLDIKGDLTLSNGIFNTNGYNLNIGGNWTNTAGDTGFEESTGTVFLYGPNSADINTDETFYNLNISKTYEDYDGIEIPSGKQVTILNELLVNNGTLKMRNNSSLLINGNVFIGQEAGINAGDGDTSISIMVGGNWNNENSFYDGKRGFTPGGETLTLFGNNETILFTSAPQEVFNNLRVDKIFPGSFRPNSNIRILGDLNIVNAAWWDNSNSLTHTFYGDFTVQPDGIYISDGTTAYLGSQNQHFFGDGFELFKAVIINKSGNSSLQLHESMSTEGDGTTNVISGILDCNGYNFLSAGNIYINNNGKVLVPASSTLFINTNLYISGNGCLIASGVEGNLANIEHPGTSYYGLEVTGGGVISAEYTHFKDMNTNGIKIYNGGLVDESHAFNYCIIDEGQNSAYSARLRLYNNQILSCNYVEFPNNPGIPNVFNAGKSIYDFGHVNFVNSIGDFAGEDYEADPFGRIDWTSQGLTLYLKVYLEGPFISNIMNTTINAYIPLNQPFNCVPWNYNGPESVTSIPNSNVVDWILVELRETTGSASTATSGTMIARQAGFLLGNGTITSIDGTSAMEFNNTISANLYVVIYHRNHLSIMSSVPVTGTGGVYSYDFTSSQSQVYGGNLGHKQLSPVAWGMVSGDGNGDGFITNTDKLQVWRPQTGLSGYFAGDFNLNGQVNNDDKLNFWRPNSGYGTQIP